MEASKSGSAAAPTQCAAKECGGFITQVWWGDENTVLFLRHEGLRSDGPSLYAWTVATGAVSLIARMSNSILAQCDVATNMGIVCVREASTLPPHVAFIDPGTDGIQVLADVNPEFQNITLGNVERFEWNTPTFKWSEPGAQLEGVYEDRTYGYILYPPDFDPARKYPVFISPYAAAGFDNTVNQEYALHAMAANGFVVLNLTLPSLEADAVARVGPGFQKLGFSAELGFPQLSMQLESTVRALDLAVSRGFVDERRVGIGGVSAGASMPARMLQKYDRLAAVSIAGGLWSHLEYYAGTQRLWQPAQRASSWMVKPVGSGLDFWRQIELADNVETIEAPILINTPATETVTLIRLMRHMAEAGKPYDAYVFPQEPHIKWQPAHLRACMQRNLDWFRFWLQSYEDPAPGKSEQYARWRKLREMHAADRARAAQQSNRAQLSPQPPAAPAPVPN